MPNFADGLLMRNFVDVLSGVQQRTFDRLSGHSSASTDIVMEPTDHEAEQYGNVQRLSTGLAGVPQSNAIYSPRALTTGISVQSAVFGTGAAVSFMEQTTTSSPYSSYHYFGETGWPWISSGSMAEAPLTPNVEVVDAPSREMLKRVPVDAKVLDLTDVRQKLATEAEDLLGYTPLRRELHGDSKLQRVLAKLEISTLEEKSVFAYKNQMAQYYSTTGKMPDPTWRITPLEQYAQAVPEFVLHKALEIKRELPEAMFYVEQLAIDPFLIVTLTPLYDFMSSWNTLQRAYDQETTAYVEVWSEPKFEATM